MTSRVPAALIALSLAVAVPLGCSDDDDSGDRPDGTETDEVTGPPLEELDGAALYELNCSACHRPGGTGIEGIYPALAGSAFVSIDDPRAVAETIVHGRAGMPAWGQSLSDTEIAAILTYLRTELNDAEPVDPEVVRDARDRPALDDERRDEDESGNQEEQGDEE